MIWGIVYDVILLGCCAFAFAFGGWPERAGAAIMFTASMASWAALAWFGAGHAALENGILIVDIVTLAALTLLVLRADRYWPIWATGFHLVGLTTHGAVMADKEIGPLAYAHALGLWGYLPLLMLVLGSAALRTYRSGATMPSWLIYFGPFAARKRGARRPD